MLLSLITQFPGAPEATLSQSNVTLTSTATNPLRVAFVTARTSEVRIFAEKNAEPWSAYSSKPALISAGDVSASTPNTFQLDTLSTSDSHSSFSTRKVEGSAEIIGMLGGQLLVPLDV